MLYNKLKRNSSNIDAVSPSINRKLTKSTKKFRHLFLLPTMPERGLHLSWDHIDYSVPQGKSVRNCLPCVKNDPSASKQILFDVTGSVPPAQLLAVMGSSGAGKTTFLNVLAQQVPPQGTQTGTIYIDGQEMTKNLFRKHCGYVRQDDVLLPNLSVRETIEFYADLRLPSSLSRKEKKERVDRTISKLGLTHCQDSLIGGERVRGISGGEKRRVSIAVELIRNPNEPTSGLDARTSLSVVNTLADLAHNHNHTIVCTIHQPRAQAFAKFDRLLLLAHGHQIFSGDLPKAEGYFSSLGYTCPDFENPADFYIDMLTVNTTSTELEEESKRRINDIMEKSIENNQNMEKETYEPHIDEEGELSDLTGAGRIRQTYLITKRSWMNNQRNPGYLFARAIQSFIMAMSIALLWWQIDNDQSAIQDRLGVVFIGLIGSAFPEAMVAASVFPLEREVFRRERKAGMYKLTSYYIGKQVAEFPLQVIAPALFAFLLYWCVGLPADIWIFGTFLSLVLLMALCVSSLGLLTGAIFPAQGAVILLPCFLLVSLLLAGFYVHPDNLPTWIGWAQYGSLFYYAYKAIILNQFNDLDFYCKDDQYVTLSATATCSNGDEVTVSETTCPITDGRDIVEDVDADEFDIWQYQLLMLGFIVLVRLAIFPALKYASPREMDA